jgi:uroporphyrinogen decarboxylase
LSSGKFSQWKHENEDESWSDIWGAKRRTVKNDYASYDDLYEFPLSSARSAEDLKKFSWPGPSDWDFTNLNEAIEEVNPNNEYFLKYRLGSIFETAWSLCGLETFLENLLINPGLTDYLLSKITDIHLSNLETVLSIAGDKIDMVYTYDDLAHQYGMLMSRDLWLNSIARYQKKIFSLAREANKEVMYHCCGDVCKVIPDLIDMGVTVLNPLQPLAISMDFQTIKDKFGQNMTFHGGIDIQRLLPEGTTEEVKENVRSVLKTLGKDGGYILSPAHHIQADTPVENVIAIYTA